MLVCGAGAVSVLLNTLFFPTRKFPLILISFALIGMTTLPGTSVCIEYGCEIAYPSPPSAVAGALLSVGYFAASTVVFISGFILSPTTNSRVFTYVNVAQIALLVIGMMFALHMERMIINRKIEEAAA